MSQTFRPAMSVPIGQLHALRMADAVLRIVPPFQLLEARIIFCPVISRWPIFESKIRIVCVVTRDSGFRDVSAHPTYRLLKDRPVPGRFPVCLGLAQVRKSAMRICAIHIGGNRAAQSIDLKNHTWKTQDLFENTGQRGPDVGHSFVISGAGVFKINRARISIIPGQGFLEQTGAPRRYFLRQAGDGKPPTPFAPANRWS